MAVDLAEVQRLHPEWDLVALAPAPGGGFWAVGRDGGVFTLNAEGRPAAGAPAYHGSYTGLPEGDRLGTREFTGIRENPYGGYTLVSNVEGQTYAFGPQSGPTVTTPQADVKGPGEATNTASGKDEFMRMLTQDFKLPASLGERIWNTSKTKSPAELASEIRNSPEYAARFPGLVEQRSKPGTTPGQVMDESTYLATEERYKHAAIAYGLPAGFHDDVNDFAKLIINGVSPAEYASRIKMAQTAALGTDPNLRLELGRLGLGAGDLTAIFLDPDKGTQVITEKYAKAEIGAASRRTAFGMLTEQEIDTLYARGITGDQASDRFAALGGLNPLIQNTAEETTVGDKFTRDEQLGLITDPNGASASEVDLRRRRRTAAFEGGGGAATGGRGATGLGSAGQS